MSEHTLSTYFNQREIKKIRTNINSNFPIKIAFPPKKSNFYKYLYCKIDPQYFDICIQYFRDPKCKSANKHYLIGLAGLCKSIITVDNIWEFYFTCLDDSHILHLPEYVKEQTINSFEYLHNEIAPNPRKADPIDVQIRKVSLFEYQFQYWSIFVKMIKKNYSDGLFHQFNFEEAIFLIYFYPDDSIILSKKNYHKFMYFYVNCIAAAVKTFMEKFGYTINYTSPTQNNDSNLCELIFLDFLDFYEKQFKINEKVCKYYE